MSTIDRTLDNTGTETDEELLARALEVAKRVIAARDQRIREQAAQLEAQASKVLFAESVENSDASILVGQFAHDLRRNGIDIKTKRLFSILRERHYLRSQRGQSWNDPTPRSLEHGWFEVRTRTVTRPDGSMVTIRTPMITGKGRIHLTQLLMAEHREGRP